MANQEKISHSLHALRRSSSQTPMPEGPRKAPGRIWRSLKALDRNWRSLKAPGNAWQAPLRAPDRIKAALKPPDRIKAALKAPEKTRKPRPITWRPAGV